MTEPLPWPDKTDRLIFDELDSTMAEAARIGPDLKRPTWIMARRQTAAHGRRGRPWSGGEGNLAATLCYRPGGPLDQAALRSFVASVSLYYALALLIDRTRLSLKWPNDVLLDGGKVAGILLEAFGPPEAPTLAVGIGVNLVTAPGPDKVEPGAVHAVSVADAGGKGENPEDVLTLLASHYDQHERLFTDLGFDPIRRLWLRHAARLGETITARMTTHSVTGRFETVDAAGHLVLKTRTGLETISAADVFF